MRSIGVRRLSAMVAATVGLLAASASGAHAQAPPPFDSFTFSSNMQPLGFSARTVPLDNDTPGQGVFNTDLAFWGNLAAQGTYGGFRLLDISNPASPRELVNYTGCAGATNTVGNQGDVILWSNLLIHSWNSPVSAANAPTASCGGELVGQGFEGLNIFDISDPANPKLVKNLRMAADTTPAGCGSHTATAVPDVARGNLYVYNNGSSGTCPGIDIVKIPLANPAGAQFLSRAAAGRSCHDTGVILDRINLVACAGGNGFTVFSIDPTIDPPAAGSIENPTQLYSQTVTGVTVGHSASFSWDGDVLIFGHEPGGGSDSRCQATSTVTERSLFFYAARTGAPLGTFVHPRPQTSLENCTWHNYNIVPTTNGKRILVAGNYQSGVSVVDFTDPANASEIASADPAPLVDPNPPVGIELGGDWSTYWYNGTIYESDITRGLLTWKLNDPAVAGAKTLSHLNPQTMYMSLGTSKPGNVGGNVPATLSLTLGPAASFGAFTPGIAKDYTAATTANVISTAGDALLSVADPSSTATGHLVNGTFSLPEALQARATKADTTGTAFNNVGSSAIPLNLLTWSAPVSNDPVNLEFKQHINANDALRTGTYSKTLTFTLSTTTP